MWTRRAVAATTAATAVLATVVTTAPIAHAATTLPDGFVLLDTPTGQAPGSLTDVAYLPDGSALTTGRQGSVRWVPQGGQPAEIATIPVFTGGSLGLTGIAVAPDYATSRVVYTTQAIPSGDPNGAFRLSRWRTAGTAQPTGLVDESVILQFTANSASKGIQDIAVEPGGDVLWVAIGDNANVGDPATATKDNVDKFALRAMDPNLPTGKILRIRTDGKGVSTNPFFDPQQDNSWRSRVYLSGLRDPRIALDPAGGAVVTDTGWAARDEVNLAVPGQNQKWPCWEGTTRTPGYRDLPECATLANTPPIQEANHGPTDSLIGGAFYNGVSYPAGANRYFFANKGNHTLSTLGQINLRMTVNPLQTFASEVGDPVSLVAAPNGDIVFADAATSTLRRLSHKPGNKVPTAEFSSTVDPVARKVSFDASASVDPDRDLLAYQWDFGDGSTGTGVKAEHTYATGDPVTVTLTTTDPLGGQKTASQQVVAGEAGPELNLTPPAQGTTFSVGDPISLAATAHDAVDGDLDISWKASTIVCSRNRSCETYSLATGTGAAFAKEFPNFPDVEVLVTASAKNSRNVPVVKRYIAKPTLARLSVVSSHPSHISINYGGVGSNLLLPVKSTFTVASPDRSLDGISTFAKWTETANQQPAQEVQMVQGGVTLHAEYVSPVQKRYADDAGIRAAVGTPVGVELIETGVQWQEYSTGRIYWTDAGNDTRVAATYGDIAKKYIAVGGHAAIGPPLRDDQPTQGATGRYNHFVNGAGGPVSIFWSQATGAQLVQNDIRGRWQALGFETAYIGFPRTSEAPTPTPGGLYNLFERGSIYWSPVTGAHNVQGAINAKWVEKNSDQSYLGFPITDDTATTPAGGFYNHFQRGGIYFSDVTGAHNVQGAIFAKWAEKDYNRSYLGFPTTDDSATVPAGGFYNLFQRGAIYFSDATGAHNIQGSIYTKWVEKGSNNSYLGLPTTDDAATFPAGGFYNLFQNGAIFYSDATGAHNVQGAIYQRWKALGHERSYLGYPINDDHAVAGGYQSDFQNGYIFYNSSTGQVIDKRY